MSNPEKIGVYGTRCTSTDAAEHPGGYIFWDGSEFQDFMNFASFKYEENWSWFELNQEQQAELLIAIAQSQ